MDEESETDMERDRARLRVVGWGPFRWPWERRRERRAFEQARRLMKGVR